MRGGLMEKVLFDPGYSSCFLGISDSVEFIYDAFCDSVAPFKQKKFQFSALFSKIKNMAFFNVSFYLGCLLWACYIKSFKDAVIENNPCLNQEYNEEASLEEVNYLIEFLTTKLNRDTKYYINKTFEADPRHIKILETYKDFIITNKGLCAVEKTSDIILPENLKKPDKKALNAMKNKIDEAIKLKDLTKLFDVYDLIF